MKKNLLQTISILELLLLIIVGILSNKIADLFEINQTILWVATLTTVTALAIITIYKTKPVGHGLPNFIKEKVDIKITKKAVGSILKGIIYFPSALLLSTGAFHYSQAMDKDWLGILSGCAVSGLLIFAPLLLDQIKEEQQSIMPITIGFILCVIYGSVGMYIDIFPETVNSHFLLLAMISATTFVGLKYVFAYYTLLIPFGKWYKNLPDK